MTRHQLFASLIATAVPLLLLAESGCNIGGGHCSGGVQSCELHEAYECTAHDGCHVEAACSIVDCSSFQTPALCQLKAACTWGQFGCQVPDVNPCDPLRETECGALTGCKWGDVCTGQGIDCYDFDSKGACETASGCSWDAGHTF